MALSGTAANKAAANQPEANGVEVYIRPMTAAEARAAADQSKDYMGRAADCLDQGRQAAGQWYQKAAPLIAALQAREGWKALAYSSWREFCEAEYGVTIRRIQQVLAAYQLQTEEANPVRFASIPERQCRELAAEKDPVIRRAIHNKATANGTKPTTAAELRQAREEYHAATSPAAKIAALNRAREAAKKAADRRDLERKVKHAEKAADLLLRCLKWYAAIEATLRRARRHHGIACGEHRDPVMEAHIEKAVKRAGARQEALEKQLAAMVE
jgi:hypothetical protein